MATTNEEKGITNSIAFCIGTQQPSNQTTNHVNPYNQIIFEVIETSTCLQLG